MWKFVLVLGLCLSACRKEELRVITVPPVSKEDIALSQIAEDVIAVPLGEMPDRPLSTIFSVVRSCENIFVLEQEDIRRFDKNGHFLNTIGKKGHGPGEYTYLAGFCVDTTGRYVYALTAQGIFRYSYEGEISAHYKNIRGLSNELAFIQDRLYVFSEKLGQKTADENGFLNTTTLYRFNRDLDLEDSLRVRTLKLSSMSGTVWNKSFPFSAVGKEIYVYKSILLKMPFLADTLYRISDWQLVPELRLDFGVSPGADGKMEMVITNLYRTKRFIFCDLQGRRENTYFCYDLKSGQGYYTSGNYKEDRICSMKADLCPLNMEKGEMYFVKEGYELEGKMEGITENSNPVIFFVKLKEK